MVKSGGHFLQVTNANNFMGHGFYQFSPELLYRVFSPENGFEIRAVLLHEVIPGGHWYAVSDPVAVQQRVELCNSAPTYILTIARKVADREPFIKPPFQSDYSAIWRQAGWSSSFPAVSRTGGTSFELRHLLPVRLKRFLWKVRHQYRVANAFDRPCYKFISEDNFLRGVLGG
jgi:hypothetical protein